MGEESATPSASYACFQITVDNRGWLLKNSLTAISQKLLRVRKLYERFVRVSWTFSITRLLTFFRKTDFFNSHRDYHYLSQNETSVDANTTRWDG